MDEGDQLLNEVNEDGKSIKSLTSFKTDDEMFKYNGGIPKEPQYSKWFQSGMYMVAISAGILQGY